MPKSRAAAYAKSINAHFFLTSAKQNVGITKMFEAAAEMCANHLELRNDVDVSKSKESKFGAESNRCACLFVSEAVTDGVRTKWQFGV